MATFFYPLLFLYPKTISGGGYPGTTSNQKSISTHTLPQTPPGTHLNRINIYEKIKNQCNANEKSMIINDKSWTYLCKSMKYRWNSMHISSYIIIYHHISLSSYTFIYHPNLGRLQVTTRPSLLLFGYPVDIRGHIRGEEREGWKTEGGRMGWLLW